MSVLKDLTVYLLPSLQPVANEQGHYLVVPSVSTIKSLGELTLLDEKPVGATGRTNKFKHRGGYAGPAGYAGVTRRITLTVLQQTRFFRDLQVVYLQ